MCWCVVHVRAGRELAAADLLQRNLRLRVYLPEVRQRWQGKMQLGPLFPGYLFVSTGSETGSETGRLAQVEAMPGCGRLVRSGSWTTPAAEPVRIEDGVVAQLQQHVEQLNATGGLPALRLRSGDSVQIKTGPMRGLDAIFLGPLTPAARVQVLLHFLGREQQVTVALDDIEPCAPDVKRVRRTRGHGRRIRSA